MEPKPRNDRQNAVTKFCLAMETFRRTDAGRVKNARELVDHFFPHDATKSKDQLFVHLPCEVRAPVVAGWGIRGAKAALRDDDERIRSVIHDALLAGDIDAGIFEEGISAGIVTDWVPLADWWGFWRSGKVTGVPVQKALATGRELGLFDDRWFLENLEGRGGKLKGSDTIADTLSKEQIVAWVRGLHASGDGSPAGIVAAIGWEVILAKTSQEALLFALDALAKKVGLAKLPPPVRGNEVPGVAVPEFPIEEKATNDFAEPAATDAALPSARGSEWPERAAPGDMGYALTQPSIRPSFGLAGGADEVTTELQSKASPK